MLAHWMPFTAHMKLHPHRPGKRFEQMRDLQKLGYLVYQALAAEPTLNLARPGGGQALNFDQYSDLVYGTAVKPQIGETPAQAMITGFWSLPSTQPVVAQPQVQLISSGKWVTGPYNQTPYAQDPDPNIQAQVKLLVTLLESRVAALYSGQDPIKIFRLDYANIIWGDRGRHLPR